MIIISPGHTQAFSILYSQGSLDPKGLKELSMTKPNILICRCAGKLSWESTLRVQGPIPIPVSAGVLSLRLSAQFQSHSLKLSLICLLISPWYTVKYPSTCTQKALTP